MRFKQLLVGALGAALLGALPVALASSPAQAGTTDTLPTRVVLARTAAVSPYGTKVVLAGRVEAYSTDPAVCSAASHWCVVPDTETGKVSFSRKYAGYSTFAAMGARADESSFSWPQYAKRSVVYRVRYSGGTYGTYTLAPSVKDKTVKVSRNLHTRGVRSGGKLYLKGNVDPGWAHRYVIFQKKNCGSCSWHKFKSVKTNRYGAYVGRIYAPRTGRDYYRVKIAATAPRFVTGYSAKIYETYQYRARTSTPGAGITAR